MFETILYQNFWTITLVVFILFLFRKRRRNNQLLNLLPSPKAHFQFAIGNSYFYLLRGTFCLQNYNFNTYLWQIGHYAQQLHLKDSLYLASILNVSVIILLKASAFESLYSSSANIQKSNLYSAFQPIIGMGLEISSGSRWRKKRKLLTPAFFLNVLNGFLPSFNKHAKDLVETLKDSTNKEWINIEEIMSVCSTEVICGTVFGLHTKLEKHKVLEYVNAVQRATNRAMKKAINPFQWIDALYYRTEAGRAFKKDCDVVHNFSKEVLAAVKKQQKEVSDKNTEKYRNTHHCKQESFLGLLFENYTSDKGFSENDILEEMDTFVFGGNDTTGLCLSWTLYLIGLDPKIQQKIHAELDKIMVNDNFQITSAELSELKYLERVIKESLRLYPPGALSGRLITEDIRIDGYLIPKGVEVFVATFLLHKDPDIFANPEVFDPDRFLPENTKNRHPYAYVPFAAGPRNCIGQKFAMMEMKVILATVLKHYVVKALDPRDKILPCINVTLSPSYPIRLKITPR